MPLRARCCSKLLMSSYRCSHRSQVSGCSEGFGLSEQFRMHFHHQLFRMIIPRAGNAHWSNAIGSLCDHSVALGT